MYDLDYFKNLKATNDRICMMKIQVGKFQNKIQWANNATCNDVDELVRAAKMGLDCGLERTLELMPTNCFHQWVKYCFTFTRLYNRDRPAGAKELLCITRMVLFLSCIYLFKDNCCCPMCIILLIETQFISSVRPTQRTLCVRCLDAAPELLLQLWCRKQHRLCSE